MRAAVVDPGGEVRSGGGGRGPADLVEAFLGRVGGQRVLFAFGGPALRQRRLAQVDQAPAAGHRFFALPQADKERWHIDRWPLREAGTPSGMRPADLDATGQPVEPRTVNRSIPFQISAAAVRSVQDGGGIRTAPTLLNLLQQATAVADRTEQIGAVGSTPPAGTAGASSPTPETGPDDDEARARRRRRVSAASKAPPRPAARTSVGPSSQP